jgi:glutamyl-tRNA synthetase
MIRVRFAPSPTGELHIGGARTAVFNWLFARQESGKFLLRIEDTDTERSSEVMTEHIIEGLKWLGLDWDEEPVFQLKNLDNHKKNAQYLLENGAAYRCFCNPIKLNEEREAALKGGLKSWKYPGYCRQLSEKEIEDRKSDGKPFSLRFKVKEGKTSWDDLIHGQTAFDNDNIEDFVLMRSNGFPTYHLSVVSDDIFMEITHIIRGDDHISNTPKQILIYEALGTDVPRFGHIPLILGPDKKRLSKRHGAASLLEYREKGYLPEALLNFISLLGWSPGDDREYMHIADLVKAFSLSGVNKSGAVFDEKKLEWLNGKHINDISLDDLIPFIKPLMQKEALWNDDLLSKDREYFIGIINLVKARCRLLTDFPRDLKPYLSEEIEYDDRGVKKYLTRDGIEGDLRELGKRYETIIQFNRVIAEEMLRKLAEETGSGADKYIHPLRMALVGVPVSPGVFEVAEIMGKEKTISRLNKLADWLEKQR